MPQVMLINTRATWLAGPDAGLSTAYRFAPGVAVEVTAADAALLLAGLAGHEFVKADTDVAAEAAATAAAVAEWKAGGYKPGKGDQTEDAEPSVPPQGVAGTSAPASVTSAEASTPPGAARTSGRGGGQ